MKALKVLFLSLLSLSALAQSDPVAVPVRTDSPRPFTSSWMNLYVHTDGRVLLFPRTGNPIQITNLDFSTWRQSVETRLANAGSGSSGPVQASNVVQSENYRFTTDTEKAIWNGKQNALGYTPLNPANNLSELTASSATVRTNLGLGTMATQNANAVAITGGSISGLSSLSATGSIVTSGGLGARRILGNSSTPTAVVGTGAGTGATIAFTTNSNDIGGQVTITTGTAPATSAQIARITFTTAYGNGTFTLISPANANATAVFPFITNTASYFDLNSGPVALSASTTYVFNYVVTGK